MSAIFNETLTFTQGNGPPVRLVVYGDEYYARYETEDGYTVVYDAALGQYCFATNVSGRLVSTTVPLSSPPPAGVRRHLQDAEPVRRERYVSRLIAAQPPAASFSHRDSLFTIGPNQGLLPGRRLTLGPVRGLTVLVEFQDLRSTVTRDDVNALLNNPSYTANGNFCSVRDFFRLVSTGKLDFTNTVVGPYLLSRNQHFYTETPPGRPTRIIQEALDMAVAEGLDLNQFDSRNEGIVDAINVMYAGQTQYLGDLWPHNFFIDLRYGNVRTYFYSITSMGRTPADLSIGTFCHENGHLLCRFPDLYDYGDPEREGDAFKSFGLGSYCVMGSGNHLNRGRTPAPVSAYLRDLAGWCDRVVSLNQPGRFEVKHGDYTTVHKFELDLPNEYFLVENRSKAGLDLFLPSSGLAVYHCDTLGSNEFQQGTAAQHYQAALLQADGHLDLEHGVNGGDGTDLYAGIAGVAISDSTVPSSRRWDGSDSGLVISEVGLPGETIQFAVGSAPSAGNTLVLEQTPQLTIPDDNPAGVRSEITVDASGALRNLRVGVDITHTYIGDLVVELTAPSGQTVILHNRAGAGQDNLIRDFDAASTPGLAVLAGAEARGAWALQVRDLAGIDTGKLNRWRLELSLDAAEHTVRAGATPALAIPDADPAGVASSITLEDTGAVAALKVAIDITHTYIGDLRVELRDPTGRAVVLHGRLGGSEDNLRMTYDSTPPSPLAPLVGQPLRGAWVLRVADLARRDKGVLNSWSIEATTRA